MFINFRERIGERKRDQNKRNIDQLPPICALMGNQIQNTGMCSDQKLNLPPFGVWVTLQPTESLAMATL